MGPVKFYRIQLCVDGGISTEVVVPLAEHDHAFMESLANFITLAHDHQGGKGPFMLVTELP